MWKLLPNAGDLVRWLQRMDDGQRAILEKLEAMSKDYVQRTEWDQYRTDQERRTTWREKRQDGPGDPTHPVDGRGVRSRCSYCACGLASHHRLTPGPPSSPSECSGAR
ncbi:hypothetical protein GCM10023221_17890 [Luteimicrobium xylanilyticum]